MGESPRDRYTRWGVDELLAAHTGLRPLPVVNDTLRIRGEIAFDAVTPGYNQVADAYEVELSVPPGFPTELPAVRDLSGRVPKGFHTHPGDGTLCLGSPTRQRLALVGRPTLLVYVTKCVIPYLYGFSHKERHRTLPFGELDHGNAGLLADFAVLFGVPYRAAAEMVRLTSLRRRVANKARCPCGSGKRLGRCHHRRVNRLREELGRRWFRAESRRFTNAG